MQSCVHSCTQTMQKKALNTKLQGTLTCVQAKGHWHLRKEPSNCVNTSSVQFASAENSKMQNYLKTCLTCAFCHVAGMVTLPRKEKGLYFLNGERWIESEMKELYLPLSLSRNNGGKQPQSDMIESSMQNLLHC